MAVSLVDWSEKLETGLAWQDEQHRELFDRLVALHTAIEQRQSRKMVSQTLDFLDGYVETHFSQEEDMMRRYSYPASEQHLKEHQEFRQMLVMFHHFVTRTRKLVLAAKIRTELNQWFLRHIETTDKELGAFLQEKGADS
ncbi:MAG: bacteriohemerythrin [Desulfobulbaceae bacterium]|nr:bacteriohemerythrin [Desulfobulbaceae bacterium]